MHFPKYAGSIVSNPTKKSLFLYVYNQKLQFPLVEIFISVYGSNLLKKKLAPIKVATVKINSYS